MNKVKKIFIISASVITVSIILMLSILSIQRFDVGIELGSPYIVQIYNHSTTTAVSVNSDDTDSAEKYNAIIDKTKNLTNISKLARMTSSSGISGKIYLDDEKKYVEWSTDIKTRNLVVEFIYNSQQDLVVYQGKNSKVISYYCLAFVLPEHEDVDEIIVYYSTTSETSEKDNDYKKNKPLTLYGSTKDFFDSYKSLIG